MSGLVFLCYFVMRLTAKGSREKQERYADLAWSTFYTLTYVVFASVSKTVFDTFNCSQIGDDPHYWLARDHSIDCNSTDHKWYKSYATIMIFFYPVGIPVLYAIVLNRSRHRLQETDRDYDPKVQKIAFLWQNYELSYWWMEVFECLRRLGLSGVLVFVEQGSASQVSESIIITNFFRTNSST
jgi:hypothetical protein